MATFAQQVLFVIVCVTFSFAIGLTASFSQDISWALVSLFLFSVGYLWGGGYFGKRLEEMRWTQWFVYLLIPIVIIALMQFLIWIIRG